MFVASINVMQVAGKVIYPQPYLNRYNNTGIPWYTA